MPDVSGSVPARLVDEIQLLEHAGSASRRTNAHGTNTERTQPSIFSLNIA
jgi:hypothetical protein